MLNVGLIGNTENLEPHAKRIQKNPKVNITGKASVGTSTRLNSFHFSIPEFNRVELIERADIILMDNTHNHPFSLLSDIIRRSKHVFITNYLNLTVDELLQLIKLANEAGIVIQFSNPYYYFPAIQWLNKQISLPLFIDISHFSPELKEEKQLLFPLLLMLHDITGLSPKKIAAVSFHPGKKEMLFNNIRLEFGDASVVNINYGKLDAMSKFKLKAYSAGQFVSLNFQQETFTANNIPIDLGKESFPEELESFVNSVQNKSKVIGSIEDFLIVQHAILKILKKLSQFSDL